MNNEKILENVNLKISISTFCKEEEIKMRIKGKNVLKIVAMVCIMIISVTSVVFAKDIGEFIKNLFGQNSSEGIDTAVNNGYVADVNAEIQSADGINVKIETFIMDDYNFAMNFRIILDKKYNITDFGSVFLEDLRIIDEQENIVFSTNYNLENVGTANYEPEYWNGYSMLANKISENELILSLSTSSNIPLPKSQKLKINFTRMVNRKESDKIYKGNWNFEIDVPKEFYNRELTVYKAISCNDKSIDLDQIQVTLSNTALKLYIPVLETKKVNYEALKSYDGVSIYNMIALQKEYVKTSNGKKYETSKRSDGDGGYGVIHDENKITNYHQTFNLTKFDATDNIEIHILTNKKDEIVIKLKK